MSMFRRMADSIVSTVGRATGSGLKEAANLVVGRCPVVMLKHGMFFRRKGESPASSSSWLPQFKGMPWKTMKTRDFFQVGSKMMVAAL